MTAFRAALAWLLAIRRRLLLLAAFAAVFLIAAASARLLTAAGTGHADLDRIFEVGGPTLASAYVLAGWAIGRFPLLAVLVLMAGVLSEERASGLARLHLSRPISPYGFYGVRALTLAGAALGLSVLLLPAFDWLLLGHTQPGASVLAAAWIIAYGGLIAALSVWTRADAWIALLLAILATSWHALRAGGVLDAVPAGARQFLTLILPPHGALLALENAFGQGAAVPWDAFLNACLYGVVLLLIGGLALERREL
jgi:hypothetical protein